MKAYTIGSQQGIASLTAVTKDVPKPGPSEVLVKVRAVALNHRDLLIVSSKYGAPRPEDRVPVSDGVGEIAALGEGVTGYEVGQRVTAPHFVSWTDGPFSPAYFGHDLGVTHDGWLAEYVLVPAQALVKVPDSLTDRQVAALSGAALTAWNALVEVGRIKASDTVLALGTGGVSIMALQIARMCGARVAITSSSNEKLEQARALGAEVTVNYREDPEWEKIVFAQLGNGADIVVETGGLATLRQSIAAAAPNGRIAIIGALAGAASEPLPNFGTIIGKNLAIHGIAAGGRGMLQRLVNAIAANGMEPVINKVFGFDEAAQAYSYLHSGDHFGKVMIQVA
jgi:NADPH:quinone reductase-like Zn-dependent oxidoreductase